ncbi:protein FAM117A-like isoform X1 [Xiphophorus maculatus]|uniref:Family with sequence similarity 117 member Aa n=1 Tax=Xiphophorus maculatus TaxID=8083 RepID=M4A168_XIPMA|nr:protein FAM117A-like isoform X1 [Xiphophorus maculatus]XP_023205345.1 protein FAM117A-like isoform X1 [Xiphophorus maculatus]
MSGRSGGAPRGCSNPSLQPLRATVPFQLQRGSAPLCREPKAVDKTAARPPRPTIRRTLSLDTIVGPYLQGQWPREAEAACVNDKATQTPCCWTEETRGRRSAGGHKRSASWGSAEHLKEVAKVRHHLQKRSRNAPPSAGYELPHGTLLAGQAAGVTQTVPMIPLNRLAPRLRRSVEGLSLELEEVFVSEKPDDEHEILDIPDGHRAPVPAQRCSSGSQSEPSPSLPSPSLSPCPLDSSLPSGSPCHLDASRLSPSPPPYPMLDPEPAECEGLCSSSSASLPSFALEAPLQQPCSSSPRPNKTYAFQRIPPEGCERIRVCEEAMSACPDEQLLQPSCPDPNKVNFSPHGGSAFCPVSLLKPLLPSMDLLFRSLSVSPVTGCSGQDSPTRHLGMQ